MKKSPSKVPAHNPLRQRVSYSDYKPPTVSRQEKDVILHRLYPPKDVGPPDPSMIQTDKFTEKVASIMLRDNHYRDGGVWIHDSEIATYFDKVPTQQAADSYQVTSDQDGNITTVNPSSKISQEQMVEDHFVLPEEPIKKGAWYERVKKYLLDNNYNTKARLEKMSLQEWAEKYTIPDEILNPNQ